jgi:p-hydroxybenzoate 3-monooxygenase
MNLALQDADELVAGLFDRYRSGDSRRLNAYSTTRLPRVWRTVEFSHWMLELLLAYPAQGRFREGLRDARLARLIPAGNSPNSSRSTTWAHQTPPPETRTRRPDSMANTTSHRW